ncbi:Flp family type IVb pilin [Arthrobacter sp. FW306-2-2C-D06B]|uniref:Flp family type IVb pilin n=1 Tax=Arthrobacter sp. FW306-2-2C-D06B TaxID=2879618 RepID=UPI001F422B15|nr:Flp family type IVb pilin [Arthrobacter sp. FW306-2-2C-D06B]UKA57768.1 Flp family type IVb pilin [Arthrobacter sp. FW306-2-2C-D06B]
MKTLITGALSLRWWAQQLVRSEKGATAVEYGLLVALIAAVIVGVVATLGTQINTAFTTISSQL